MKRFLWISTLFCLLVTIPFAVLGENQPGAPKLYLPKESWDFGKVTAGPVLKHTFIVENKGTAELVLKAYPSCRVCLSPTLSKNNIPPKSKAKLYVDFFTADKSGEIKAAVLIQSNDPVEPTKMIIIKAFVKEKPVK